MVREFAHRRMRVTLRVGIAAVSALALLGQTAPAPALAAGNAGLHLSKTVDPAQVTVNPALGLTLGVDTASAIPGAMLTYTAVVTDAFSTFGVGGTFRAVSLGNSDATVAYYWDELQSCVQGCGNGTDAGNVHWVAFAGFVAGQTGYVPVMTPAVATGLTLTASGVPATGVTYPATGDGILGTVIQPQATAIWNYQSSLMLTAGQIALFSDPTKVGALRNVVHFEVTVRNSSAAEPYIDAEPFTNPFQSQANVGSISNITVNFTFPDGTKTAITSSQVAGLALLEPGASQIVTTTFRVPVPAARGAGETDAAYMARLVALEGSALITTASASGTGFSGPVTASPMSVTTAEHLPIVTIVKSGPTELVAGNDEVNPLALQNIGGAPASGLAVTDSLPGGATGSVTGVPSGLTVGQGGSAQATFTVPVTQTPGNLTDTAAVTWQDANGNAYGPLTSSFTTLVKSSLANARLTLAPISAGPNPPGTSQTLTATLVDSTGTPIPNKVVTFNITGANPTTGTASTDASGNAVFTYVGANAGNDVAQATVTAPGVTLNSNTANISWGKLLQPIVTGPAQGNFYPNPNGSCTFDIGPGATPAFGQNFPDILFNAPASAVPHDISTVTTNTRPFTDLTVDVNGNYNGTIVAQGNGFQAGVGTLSSFYAVFNGNFTVTQAGDLTFTILHDDGYILGVGNGATRVSGDLINPPANTPFNGYGVISAWNQVFGGTPGTATIHFPAAGTYPYELDYSECGGGGLYLALLTAQFIAQTDPLSVYVGYADGLRAGGSIFPFPWDGSPGVTFVGGCTFDAGALRFDNSGNTDITLDKVTVDIAGAHFELWPASMVVPAHQILILTQTGCFNFDTSDFSNAGCGGNNGVLPLVNVTRGGVTTTITDTNQILNTHGFDLACQGNESISWQRIAGTANTINVPLPPGASLNLTPFNVPGAIQGQSLTFTVSAMDGAGNAVPSLPISFQVFGANAQILNATTGANGLAAFTYVGASAGADTIQASAFINGLREISNQGAVSWSSPGGAGSPLAPSITNQSPVDGAVVTTPVAISATFAAPAGQTITSWRVTYQALPQGTVVTLATGSGAPPSPLAMLDPTRLVDGAYAIAILATSSAGAVQTLTSTVSVIGNLKPGRYVTTYQDLAVSVVGLPMEVRRTYDSIDKSSGDFGVGWKVSVVNFKVAPNRILGAGGWTQYNKSCVLGLCFTAFKNSTPRFVAITFPDQHTEFFDFTPQGGTNLFWECTPSFTARAASGTTSTLQPINDTACSYTGDGNIYGSNGLYSPSRFRLTTKDGRVLVLDIQSGLVSETDPFGNSLSVSPAGLTSTLGPASNPTPGPSITFTRDSQGRITDINGPLSAQHVHYGYSSSINEVQTVTDPSGNVDVYAYDPATGNLSSVTGPGNAPLAAQTYDANGRVVAVSVNGGPAVTINTDPGLLQQTFTDPSGKLTTFLTYDSLGDVVQRDDLVSGQPALTSKYQYDPVGRVTDSIDAAGNETKLVYDETATATNGNVLSVSQVNLNRTWSYQNYNSLGEPGQLVRPDGTVLISLTYDPNTGALLSTQAPGQPAATFSYLPSGELKQQVDPGGRQVNYTYDASGHVATVGDGTNPPLSVNLDSGGLLRSVTDALGNQIRYDYWPTGQLKTETNGRNNSWQYFYDPLGRLDHEVDPRLAVIQYHYNALGQLDQVTDRNLAVTTYTYDIDGNLVRETRPGNDVINYGYDPLGRVVESDNAAAHVDRSYDIAGRLQSETTCGNTGSSATPCPAPGTNVGGLPVVRISYLYTPTGQVKQVTSSDTNSTVSYTYDTNGRVQTISDPANPNAFYTYGYDTSSRLSTLQLPNGIVNNLTYGLSGDLTGIDASLNGAPVAGFDYQVDPATGRRTQLTDSAGQHTFTYNANGTLKSETHPTGSGLSNQTYSYDATGNRSAGSVTSQYDAADRLQTDGSFTYVFDGEGNLTSKTPVGGGSGTTYTWNSDHQLTSITYPNGTSSSYQYDAFGRRVKSQDPSGTTAYVYDGLDVHADYNGQGQLQKSYLPQQESVSGTSRSYYLADGLGTVRNETDSSGAITARSAYSAWGIPAAGNATGNRYTFTGYQFDPASGLFYAGSRYYDPTTGRFLSEDPQPAANSYPYAANDPVGNIDVRGEGPLIEYATFVSNAINNAECVAGVASAIATSAFSATLSALAGAQVTSDQVTAAIAVGVGLSVASCAANAATSSGGKGVQANRAVGKALEKVVIADLQKLGFARVGEQVWVRTGLGWRVIDYLAIRNGSLVAFEIKSGGSEYLVSQIAKDAWMARIGVDVFRNGTIYRIPTILIRGG